MIGTTRPRVSLFMYRIRKLGFMEHNGRIRVNKPQPNVMTNPRPRAQTVIREPAKLCGRARADRYEATPRYSVLDRESLQSTCILVTSIEDKGKRSGRSSICSKRIKSSLGYGTP